MKKVFCVFFITLMILGSFTIGYCYNYPVYAEIEDDQFYEPLRQQSDLVKAFQAYCKSRDLTIEGSVADAVTTWTTSAFNIACNRVGINVTQLQAEIKAHYNENGLPVRFLFYQTGVDAWNRLFAQFLQDNELEVGEAVDEEVYNGKYYNGTLLFITDNFNATAANAKIANSDHILQVGTSYGLSLDDILAVFPSTTSYTGNISGVSFDFDIYGTSEYYGYCNAEIIINGLRARKKIINGYLQPNQAQWRGYYGIVYNAHDKSYYVGMYTYNSSGSIDLTCHNIPVISDNETAMPNVVINITTNNNVINNNTYEGDTIIYYPDGTVDIPDPDTPEVGPDPDAPTDPLPPTDPNYPEDPVTPQTPPDWDIELPDFTDFDWIMTGLEKKFPWDIPFNIMFMMSLFVAEPEAPHFVGDIDLKVTTWHYDLDLSPFEEIAKLFRTFFFLGFILGLMLLTKQLIWG